MDEIGKIVLAALGSCFATSVVYTLSFYGKFKDMQGTVKAIQKSIEDLKIKTCPYHYEVITDMAKVKAEVQNLKNETR